MATADDTAARYRRIWAVVAAVPPGSVASYGEVAARAGMPRGARLVGRALAQCPAGLPWHRVVNATGRISLPAGSKACREQERRLRREGVAVRDGRVATAHRRRDAAGLDELLWGPGHGRGQGQGQAQGQARGKDERQPKGRRRRNNTGKGKPAR